MQQRRPLGTDCSTQEPSLLGSALCRISNASRNMGLERDWRAFGTASLSLIPRQGLRTGRMESNLLDDSNLNPSRILGDRG
jgi:hypothetical protein